MLREYQKAAVEAVYRHLRERDDNPAVVLPTGSGKSWVIAQIASDAVDLWGGRVLILAHVKELLEQNADKLRQLNPRLRIGVYSAGLKRRDQREPVIVAGVQSIWRKACDFDPFDLVIVDEAHLIPPEGDGMYRQFLDDAKKVNPHLRVIGLTATPYRLKSGSICTPDGFLNQVCHEVGVRELIVQGYLCPLVTKVGVNKPDVDNLHIRGGEYVAGEVENLMDQDALVEAACGEIAAYTATRNACLIFASGVQHGKHIVQTLQEKHSVACGFVCGDTPSAERDDTLARFQSGRLKFLCNVGVLTTGFDAPHIDCLALVRPTLSPGLYCQMVGRGFRLHPSKSDCLVLDFGGNVLRHGPVDQIRVKERAGGSGPAPVKECPECHTVVMAGVSVCPDCGFVFPQPERSKHDAKPSNAGILSGQVTVETFAVHDVVYSVHTKRGAGDDTPKSLRVDYKIGWHRWKSEWVCLEHTGFARQKAAAWWKKRSHDLVPTLAAQAVELANAGALANTTSITVRSVSGEQYDAITEYQLGEIPAMVSENVVRRGEVSLGEAGHDTAGHGEELFPFGYNVVAPTGEEIPW